MARIVNGITSVNLLDLTQKEAELVAAAVGHIDPGSVDDPEGLTRLYGQLSDGLAGGGIELDALATRLRFV